MHTPLSQILRRLRVLSDLEVQESEYTKNLTVGPGMDLMPVTDDAMEMLFEPTPCSAALDAFLSALPLAYLGALTSLMYAGRDGSDPIDTWKADISTWPTDKWWIRSARSTFGWNTSIAQLSLSVAWKLSTRYPPGSCPEVAPSAGAPVERPACSKVFNG